MVVGFRSANTASAVTSTNPVVTLPTGTANGDLLIAIQMADTRGSAASMTGPSVGTWTLADSDSTLSASVGDIKIWWKIAASEPANYTFGNSSLADDSCAVLAITAGSFDAANPLGAITFGGSATTNTVHTAPSVTGVVDGLLITVFAAGDSAAAVRSWSAFTAGLTEASDTGPSQRTGMATAYQVLSSAAATGAKTATCTDSTPYLSASFVVEPANAWTASRAETSTSSDAATGVTGQTRSNAEISTSTDSLTVAQGRGITETSTSTDTILSIVKGSQRAPAEVSISSDNIQIDYSRADIDNYQFVVVEDKYNLMNPWVPFGEGQAISGTFTPSGYDVSNQDQDGVIGDYRLFGTDRHTPPNWAWSLFTNAQTPEDALAWVEAMGRIWNHRVRKTPESVLALRYKVGNRVRRVYGRPRRFTPIPDQIQVGKIHIEADFALAESIYYDDDEMSTTITAAPSTFFGGAGIILPQPLPWTFTTPPPPQTGLTLVGGNTATWVDIDIIGPRTNPWVKIGSLTWGLTGALAIGQKITISGKPWSMGVRRSDGTNLPGWLDPRARLSALQLEPGSYSVQFGGYDDTGSSQATLRWRNAYETF